MESVRFRVLNVLADDVAHSWDARRLCGLRRPRHSQGGLFLVLHWERPLVVRLLPVFGLANEKFQGLDAQERR